MENSVIVREERRMSDTALFWTCMIASIAIGLTITYCSGIFGGVGNIQKSPFTVPDWLVIALPPVIFVHMGLSLFLALRENAYTVGSKMVRAWMWTFWTLLFVAQSILPYFVFHGMPVAAYIVASLAGGLALGTAILAYQHSISSGIVMTVLLAVTTVIMIYLGYWAFA